MVIRKKGFHGLPPQWVNLEKMFCIAWSLGVCMSVFSGNFIHGKAQKLHSNILIQKDCQSKKSVRQPWMSSTLWFGHVVTCSSPIMNNSRFRDRISIVLQAFDNYPSILLQHETWNTWEFWLLKLSTSIVQKQDNPLFDTVDNTSSYKCCELISSSKARAIELSTNNRPMFSQFSSSRCVDSRQIILLSSA